jgi:erythromycin esterase
MERFNIFALFFLYFILLNVVVLSQPHPVCDYVSPIVSIDDTTDFSDLHFLQPLVENKRVVMLGESVHYVDEYARLKARLIRYLHKELNFNVVVFESDIWNCYLVDKVKTILPSTAMNHYALGGTWQTQAVDDLMQYIKTHKMHIAGMDIQSQGYRLPDVEKAVFGNEADTMVKMEQARFQKKRHATWAFLQRWWGLLPNENMPKIDLDTAVISLSNHVETICRFIDKQFEGETIPLSLKVYKQLIIGEKNHYTHIGELFRQDTTEVPEYDKLVESRDQSMSENLAFILQALFPDEKIIVWAHNVHISKVHARGAQYMGTLLPEEIKKESYIIGLHAYTGQFDYNSERVSLHEKTTRSIEFILNTCNPIASFVDLTRMPRQKTTEPLFDAEYYPDERELVKGMLKDYYDGFILVPEVSPAIILERQY